MGSMNMDCQPYSGTPSLLPSSIPIPSPSSSNPPPPHTHTHINARLWEISKQTADQNTWRSKKTARCDQWRNRCVSSWSLHRSRSQLPKSSLFTSATDSVTVVVVTGNTFLSLALWSIKTIWQIMSKTIWKNPKSPDFEGKKSTPECRLGARSSHFSCVRSWFASSKGYK